MSPREEAIAGYGRAIDAAEAKGELDLVLRQLCLDDLFFLLVYVLGGQYANNDWVFSRCREFAADPDGHLDLWPREHFKDLPIDTPVLTANRGWVCHGDLVVGDYVFAPGGSAVRVVALSGRYNGNRC